MARPGPAVWAEWLRFLRRPTLPTQRMEFGWSAAAEVGWLLLLDLLVALPMAMALTVLARHTGLKTPEFEELTRHGPLFTLLLGALLLPVVEEMVFRSWLDGRAWHLTMAALAFALLASLVAANRLLVGNALIGALAGTAITWLLFGWWLMRRVDDAVPRWFELGFPYVYFGSALLFGLAHMTNYELDRPWLLLPFILPQAFAGLIFGFARLRYGMWANIAVHVTSNAMFLGLSLSGL